MMGWLIPVGVALAAWLLLWRLLRLPRAAWEASAAALLLGLAGYAATGAPLLGGEPAAARRTAMPVDERTIRLREEMGEGFGRARSWLVASDGAARAGLPVASVNYLRSGLRETPDSADLWVGLGNALVARAEGAVTPAARLAFGRANALAPASPAPPFFLGLALARSGARDEALALWRTAYARTPADADYRGVVAAAVASLEGRSAEAATPN